MLQRFIRHGTLTIRTGPGRSFTVGDGTGTPIAIAFPSPWTLAWVLIDPELRFGEAYMDGTLRIERGSLADLLAAVLSQDPPGKALRLASVQWHARFLWRRLQQFNPRRRAHRNVAHHYDLDARLYSLFLDHDRQYSCAYFESPDQSLDDAQLAKKRHLAAKLLVEKNARVLDIGSGWGGLALYLAEVAGAQVTGVTLSKEQLAVSRERAEEKGLGARIDFRLEDYREIQGTFDRIVSVGMFEHVGVSYYNTFFDVVASRLSTDGIAVLHSIGRSEGPGVTNPWIGKYIFPGGYIPALSEVLPAIERAGLLVTDIEILRLHYADTLKSWRERFLAHRDDVERVYDSRFVRMWHFYLASSEMAFRKENMMVMQIQMTNRQGVVPITRDYIAREEERLRHFESDRRPPLRLAGE